jgi:Nicotinate-nucleotide pyrophosphorylase
MLPHPLILLPMINDWLREDLGRGDRTTMAIFPDGSPKGKAVWIAKRAGIICGLPIAKLVFQQIDPDVQFQALVPEGGECAKHQKLP